MPLEVMIPIKRLRTLIALERPIQRHPPYPHPMRRRRIQRSVPTPRAALAQRDTEHTEGLRAAEERELRAGGVHV